MNDQFESKIINICDRVAARPAVLTVLKAEGLIPDHKVSGF
jgi:hypothetical protein